MGITPIKIYINKVEKTRIDYKQYKNVKIKL